ncbi:MAG: branched-chain amino acid ABC transporter permease [Dehalococcoidia bacterium]
MASEDFVQYLIFGVQNGSIYALIGLGFTIIYAVTNIINFAQGEFVMLGGMMSYMMADSMEVPALPAIVIALLVAAAIATFVYSLRGSGTRKSVLLLLTILILGSIPLIMFALDELASAEIPLALASILPILMAGAVGAIMYLLAIRPARRPSMVTLIIITIGASLFIRGVAGELWGVGANRTPVYWDRASLEFAGAVAHTQTLWIFAAVVIITILIQLFFSRTMLGKSLKACAINPTGARLMGIDPRMMALIAFVLAAVVGGTIGAVMAPKTGMDYERGFILGLYGFIAAALGGFKSPMGAVIGGLLLGVVMSLVIGISWGPFTSGYKDVWAMGVLLAILLLRSGKLAEEERAG